MFVQGVLIGICKLMTMWFHIYVNPSLIISDSKHQDIDVNDPKTGLHKLIVGVMVDVSIFCTVYVNNIV